MTDEPIYTPGYNAQVDEREADQVERARVAVRALEASRANGRLASGARDGVGGSRPETGHPGSLRSNTRGLYVEKHWLILGQVVRSVAAVCQVLLTIFVVLRVYHVL